MTQPILKNEKAQTFIVTTASVFCLYAWSAAPRITLMDAADLIMGTQTLGVVHPPGYPLFTLLGFLASKLLWFLDPALQINLLNAFFGAAAAGVLALIIFALLKDKILAVFGGLTLALTSVAWSLGATTEVYTLNLLLTNLLWYFAISWRDKPEPRTFYAFCFTLGLALSNSYPLIFLTALGLVWVLPFKKSTPRMLGFGVLWVAAGLLPYLYLFVQAQRLGRIDYVFFDIDGWEKVFPYIFRSHYSFLDQKASTLLEKGEVLGLLIRHLLKDFGLVVIPVGLGIYAAFQARFPLRWPLMIAILTSSLMLFPLLGTTPDMDSFVQFYVYVLPTIAYLAIFAALGVHWLRDCLKVNPVLIQTGLVVALATQLVLAFPAASHHDNDAVEAWGKTLLESLPPNAHLIFCGDESFPLQYLQLIKGIRQDVTLYSTYFGEKRFAYTRGRDIIQSLEKRQSVEDLLQSANGPVHITHCNRNYALEGKKVTLKGLTYQILGPAGREAPGMPLASESLPRILDPIMNTYPRGDHWVLKMRFRAAKMLLGYAFQHQIINADQLEDILKRYGLSENRSFLAALGAEFAYLENYGAAMQFYQKVGLDQLDAIDLADVEVLCRLLLVMGRVNEAQRVCLVPDQKARKCNADAKYNLGMAFWSQREKSLDYLRGANHCAPQAAVIRDALQRREREP